MEEAQPTRGRYGDGLHGIDATRLTARPAAAPAVIVLTTFDTDADVLASIRAGAAGFLLKHTPPEEIVAAVHRAAAGGPVLSPSATRIPDEPHRG